MASIHRPALVHVNGSCTPGVRRLDFVLWMLSAPAALLVASCGGGNAAQHVNLPAPSERTLVGAGDVLTIEIVGEKELPREYQVASDGSIDVPYVHAVKVGGLDPHQVAELVRKALIEAKVLTDPSVIVSVKEYHSQRVTLLGQVAKPGSYPFSAGLTLIQAVSLAGGLTAIADDDKVTITRKADNGKTYTAVLSVAPIMVGRAADIPLQAGDQIYVRERLF
ncbi:MAG TPA: polysaccharide biosynthesis/export family protein [Polyangiaceae bacterium]|nr:polysaccharide biosynthesis/export family protein [Polyangiaceae bacterium]